MSLYPNVRSIVPGKDAKQLIRPRGKMSLYPNVRSIVPGGDAAYDRGND